MLCATLKIMELWHPVDTSVGFRKKKKEKKFRQQNNRSILSVVLESRLLAKNVLHDILYLIILFRRRVYPSRYYCRTLAFVNNYTMRTRRIVKPAARVGWFFDFPPNRINRPNDYDGRTALRVFVVFPSL